MKQLLLCVIVLCGCVVLLSAEETTPATGKPVPGFVDTHIHQMAEFAYGGGWLYGKHNGPEEDSLACCSGLNDHGFLAGEGFLGIHLSRRTGFPQYEGWPMWDSISHQQVYAEWLRKAHEDGLTLMVMSAVNFEPLTVLIPEKHRVKEWGYKDIPAIRRQLQAAWKFTEDYSWCEIALSPVEARRIIHEGKLAIILAVETSDPFGEEEMVAQLEEFYAMGVRSLQPVHQFNNRFCGAAPHHEVFKIFQFIRDFFKDHKPARDVLYQELAKHYNVRSGEQLPTKVRQAADVLLSRSWGFEFDENGKNILGLTDEGKELIHAMIERKMLIDTAHMSERSFRGTFDIAKEHDYYPIYLSHGHIREIMLPEKAKEEKTTPIEFMPMLMETGGIFGLRTGKEHTYTYSKSDIDNACPGTTRSFAQMYLFAAEELQLTVALASDLNGFITQLKPRFGEHHDTAESEKNCPDRGKRWQNGVGSEFDNKGFAHIGLIHDIIGDLEKLGADTTALTGSSEAFLRMWERAYDANRTKVEYDVDLEAAKKTIIVE